jgi:hypothetical protein
LPEQLHYGYYLRREQEMILFMNYAEVQPVNFRCVALLYVR